MRLLLDTHAFLWFVFDDRRLSGRAAGAIAQSDTEKLLSIASVWEIVIKAQLGRLRLGRATDEFLGEFVERRQVTVVPMELAHLRAYDRLPLVHRDPFDRLLVAQAQVLGVPIATSDAEIGRYDVDVVW